MDNLSSILKEVKKHYRHASAGGVGEMITIHDLRTKEEQGIPLNREEFTALRNYEHFRLRELNSSAGEDDFHRKYKLLQALANLSPYREFLKSKYTEDK